MDTKISQVRVMNMSISNNINVLLNNLVDDAIDSGYDGQFLTDHVLDEATNQYGISAHIVKPYIETIRRKQDELFFK